MKADLQARKLVLMSLFPLAGAAASALAAGADGLVSKVEIFHELPVLLHELFGVATSTRDSQAG